MYDALIMWASLAIFMGLPLAVAVVAYLQRDK